MPNRWLITALYVLWLLNIQTPALPPQSIFLVVIIQIFLWCLSQIPNAYDSYEVLTRKVKAAGLLASFLSHCADHFLCEPIFDIYIFLQQQQRARMCGGAGLAHNAMPTGPQRSPILVSSPWNVRFLTRTPPSTKVKGEKTEPMGIEQSTKETEWKPVFKMTSVSACLYS